MSARKFIAFQHGEQDPVFNSDTQDSFFQSVDAAREGIKREIQDVLDHEPDEEISESDFVIYECIEALS